MNQSNHLPRRPNALINISRDKDLPSALPAHKPGHLLELPRLTLPLDLRGLHRWLVLVQPTGIFPPSQDQFRIRLLRPHNLFLHIQVDRRLDRAHEARPHVNALGPETQCRSEALPVREAAARDERHVQALACSAQQNEIRDVALAHVSRALEAVDAEEVDAELDGRLCMADGGAFVEDGAVCGLELLDDGAGRVAGRFDDRDAFVYDGLGVAVVVWRDERGEEGQIYAKGIGGHGPAATDLGTEGIGCGLREGCELLEGREALVECEGVVRDRKREGNSGL